MAKLTSTGSVPVSGNVNAKVWFETTQGNYVKRHFEITPSTNPTTATGKVTLYVTQAEFDAFNALSTNTLKLPTGPTDNTGKANLKIEKRSGTTNDGTGRPLSYTGTITTITPALADIVWNSANSWWEITFDVTGFSGFFIKTISGVLPVSWLSFTGKINDRGSAVLQWKVNENDVASYKVQKSSASGDFITVGTINSNGNGENTYNFTDATAVNGSVQYRINQTDISGKSSFSNTILLTKNNPQLSVYRNPVKDMLQISSPILQEAWLISTKGQLQKKIQLNSGLTTINIGNYASGIYILKTKNGDAIKIIKE